MRTFKNIVVLVSLDKKCEEELIELKDSDLLEKADNFYFVHVYNKKSELQLSCDVNTDKFDEIEKCVVDRLKSVRSNLIPNHQNKNDRSHCECLFNNSEKIKVLNYLESVSADLVIAPTRGEGNDLGLVSSSLCCWLVEKAPCDILVIRPKK